MIRMIAGGATRTDRHGRGRVGLAAALALSIFATARSADAGCGCDKPPPPPAQVRPAVAYAGAKVTLFSPSFQAGQVFTVTFTSGTNGAVASVQGTVAVRRDLADAAYKPQLSVDLPALPPGPAAISVTAAGQNSPVVTIGDSSFTVVSTPIALPTARGAWHYPGYQAGVGRDGVVYIALDVSGLKEPMVFEAQAAGYPLRYTQADVVYKNIQGFVMQLLVQQTPTGQQPVPGMFVFPATNPATDSDKLHYSRHEFNTYFLQHQERQPHAVDPTDGDWHVDGTRHIDHDHLILAIMGHMNNGALPAPGATPAFDLTLSTYSLFYQGIVGASSVTLKDYAKTDSFNSDTMKPGSDGDVYSNGTITVDDDSTLNGDATGARLRMDEDATLNGVWQKKPAGADPTFMAITVPAGLPDIGTITLQGTSQTINGPGSFLVWGINMTKASTLFVDNSRGPVTLYVVGKVSVKEGSVISVADPKPEKLAIYVAGNYTVELGGKGKVQGVVYAPTSTVTVTGDMDVRGAVVSNELKMTATSDFHYDSTLRGQPATSTPSNTTTPASSTTSTTTPCTAAQGG